MWRETKIRGVEEKLHSRLLEKARGIANGSEDLKGANNTLAHLERKIALALEKIDEEYSMQNDIHRDFEYAELSIKTELLQMEARTPKYSPYRYPEREKLNRRLQTVGQERRRLELVLSDRIEVLREKVLSLLETHEQLSSLTK